MPNVTVPGANHATITLSYDRDVNALLALHVAGAITAGIADHTILAFDNKSGSPPSLPPGVTGEYVQSQSGTTFLPKGYDYVVDAAKTAEVFGNGDANEQVLAGGEPTPVGDEAEGREMLYSSGTTGVPKGVRKTLTAGPPGDPTAASVQIAMNIGARGIGGDTVYLSPAPLYHSAPLVYCMATHRLGGTCVVMESFDAARCLGAIERYRVTHAQFVPTMFTRMLRLPVVVRRSYDLSCLTWAVHAAAPCPVAVKQEMMAWWGPIIHEYYAGTEDIGASQITPEEWLAHPGSVGRPLGEVHIVGPDDEEVPVGETGTVYFAGGREFEYHNDPEKTARMRNARGWRTLVVSGGVNIYPREAELALAAHPRVVDVAVFGVPDEEMGEALLAVVLPDDAGDPPDADGLIGWCRERLAPYKCPRSVVFTDVMPRDPSGKLFKRVLRDPYWEGRGSRIV